MAMFGFPRLEDTRRRKLRRAGAIVLTFAVALPFSTPAANAQTYSVLYNFGLKRGDPLVPAFPGAIAQGRDGNLYSTGEEGGANNLGAVFKITPEGKLTELYSFDGTHGSLPTSGLTLATGGSFYGTTLAGGTSNQGVVFRITPGGALTVLHNFSSGSDGFVAEGAPVEGTGGNFYGTTVSGGNQTACSGGCGTVYKITSSGTFSTLYQFDVTHGSGPNAPLIQGTDGNFYGSTVGGGAYGHGTIFRITPGGKLTVIHSLLSGANGRPVMAPLTDGSDGYFYGTAKGGGFYGKGTVFRITSQGKLNVIHEFHDTDGINPSGGLVQATDGNFYGTASAGGVFGFGTIYEITPQGTFSVLHDFDGPSGSEPAPLLQHTSGVVFGDTAQGGSASGCSGDGCGVFYMLNIGLGPFVSFLPPLSSGKVGKVIQIFGQGFTGTTAVSFNGTPAIFTVKSGTYLTATVPPGATTGPVTVTTPGGVLTSNKPFRVVP